MAANNGTRAAVEKVVVRRDGVRFDVDQAQQEERDQSGAVTTGTAVERHSAGSGVGERGDDGGAALGLPFQEDRIVERAAVELVAVDPLPELGVGDVVEGHLDPIDARWCAAARRGGLELRRAGQHGRREALRGPDLVIVAEVDDGSEAGVSGATSRQR
jgi:hypothetical protein